MTSTDDLMELEALMMSEEPVPEGPERLWHERDHLMTIRQFARARLASPWAVLGTVLLRALATVPPHVHLPPTVGGRASLNAFLALVGPSGAGKGAAMRAAAEAVHLPDTVPVLPLGSGEGLVKAFAIRETEESPDGKRQPVTRMIRSRILFETSEVDQFRAQGQRTGSTLLPQLRSAYSGEQLGATYASTEKAVILEPGTYRMMLVVGVQPKRSDALLGDADGGTPQRFVWLPTGDPDAAADVPEPAPYRLPSIPWPSTATEMQIPSEARQEIVDKRLDVMRGQGDPLDGHAALTRLKIAAAFAILDGRQAVNRDDWRLSALIMQKSSETRQKCVTELTAIRDEQAAERGRADAIRQSARETTKEEQDLERIAQKIANTVKRKGALTMGELRRGISSRDRQLFEEALSRALRRGLLERSGNEVLPCQ